MDHSGRRPDDAGAGHVTNWACSHFLKIYTDWANTLLGRYRQQQQQHHSHGPPNIFSRKINNLQTDLKSGTLLAEIIQALVEKKVLALEIIPDPIKASEKIENIEACLRCLRELGLEVGSICATEIFRGDLRTILHLLFTLSHYRHRKKTSPGLDVRPQRSAEALSGSGRHATDNHDTLPWLHLISRAQSKSREYGTSSEQKQIFKADEANERLAKSISQSVIPIAQTSRVTSHVTSSRSVCDIQAIRCISLDDILSTGHSNNEKTPRDNNGSEVFTDRKIDDSFPHRTDLSSAVSQSETSVNSSNRAAHQADRGRNPDTVPKRRLNNSTPSVNNSADAHCLQDSKKIIIQQQRIEESSSHRVVTNDASSADDSNELTLLASYDARTDTRGHSSERKSEENEVNSRGFGTLEMSRLALFLRNGKAKSSPESENSRKSAETVANGNEIQKGIKYSAKFSSSRNSGGDLNEEAQGSRDSDQRHADGKRTPGQITLNGRASVDPVLAGRPPNDEMNGEKPSSLEYAFHHQFNPTRSVTAGGQASNDTGQRSNASSGVQIEPRMDGKYCAKRTASGAGLTRSPFDFRRQVTAVGDASNNSRRPERPNAPHSLEVEARQATTFGHSRMEYPNQDPVRGHSADSVSDVTSAGSEVAAETDLASGSVMTRGTSDGRSDQSRIRSAFLIHKNSNDSSSLDRKPSAQHHQRICPVHSSPVHRQLIRTNGELSDHHRDHSFFSSSSSSSNRNFEFAEQEEDVVRKHRRQFSDTNHPLPPGEDGGGGGRAVETMETPPKRDEEHSPNQRIEQCLPPPISLAAAAASNSSSIVSASSVGRLTAARTELCAVAEGRCRGDGVVVVVVGGGGDGRDGGRRLECRRIADGDSGYSSDGGIAYSRRRLVKQSARKRLRPLRECIEHPAAQQQNPPPPPQQHQQHGYNETQFDLMANDITRRLFRSQSNVTSLVIKHGTSFENEVIQCNSNRCNKHGCIGNARCNIGQQQADTDGDDAREDSSRTRTHPSCRSDAEEAADITGRVTLARSERKERPMTENDSQRQQRMTSKEATFQSDIGGRRQDGAGNPGSACDHLPRDGQERGGEREVAGIAAAGDAEHAFRGRSELDDDDDVTASQDADERKIPSAAVTFCDDDEEQLRSRRRRSLQSNDAVSSSDVADERITGSTYAGYDDVTVRRFSRRHQCDDVRNHPVTMTAAMMTRSLNEGRSVSGMTAPLSTSSTGEREDALKLLRPKMAAQFLTQGGYDDPDVITVNGSDDSPHKPFRSRFKGFSGLSETGSTVVGIDYCNSLPRRARRSESVGSGVRNVVRRERGRSSDGRHSFGASTGVMALLSRAVDSLPATPRQRSRSRDDSDMHASLLSLISNASSVYSTGEENHAQEIRKLKDELELAYAKINTLTMQLNANVHVVTAFEQSLSNMTHRLQKLTNSSEQKDQELNNLKTTLYQLQQQSNSVRTEIMQKTSPSLSSSNSSYSFSNSTSLPRFNPGLTGFCALNVNHHLHHQHDKSSSSNHDSIAPSKSSNCHNADTHEPLSSSSSSSSFERKQKKKGWLSTSFTKAFSRKKSKDTCDVDEVDLLSGVIEAASSVPNSPCLGVQNLRSVPSTPPVMSRQPLESPSVGATETRRSLGEMMGDGGGLGRGDSQEIILHLKQQLHEKEMKLTDIRLEALSSAHQLEQLRDAMNQMKVDMDALKAENEKMQSIIAQKGLAVDSMFPSGTSPSSTVTSSSPSASSLLKKSLILGEPSHFESLSIDAMSKDAGPRYTVAVQLGPWTEDDSNQLATTSNDCQMNSIPPLRVVIGTVGLTSTTKWETLDSTVRRIFKEHVNRLDPGGGLGLGGESVLCYHVGEITRTKGSKMPELLPCGYLVGLNTTIILSLKGVHERCLDALAFETLIPKTVVQRYVSLLTEHKRAILCGPGGTGKTYLAGKLAEYLVIQSGRELDSNAISTFTIDSKCDQELKQYLSKMAEKCQRCRSTDQTAQQNSNVDDMPVVIIVDNLDHITSLEDVFHSFLNFNCKNCPFIIGAMTQMTSSAVGANLQMHYNYRWILLTLETEPVCHFLSRHLQRRLIEHEISSNTKSCLLGKVVEWLSTVWVQLNKFLKNRFASPESTLGTRLFASCPMDLRVSEEWFTDLWNYSIIPYLLEATRNSPEQQKTDEDGRILDPTNWVIESYPWPNVEKREFRSLLHLSSNFDQNVQDVSSHVAQSTITTDICTEGQIGTPAKVTGDPLMTILEKLSKTTSKDESTESREIPHR